MSDATGIVVAHGDLATALVDAAEGIAGVRGALVPISNSDCSLEVLRDRIVAARPAGPTVLFVDMASGSCAFAGLGVLRSSEDVIVITGVNLPMLLDFLFHRDMELVALARRLVEKGREGATAHTRSGILHADHAIPD